jgi:hypothetical protein
MTTIVNSPIPRIDEPRPVKPKSYVTPAVLVLLAAGTLTFLNLAAAVYTFRSTRNLTAIENRLGELRAFEDRVAGQLDRMNTGIQARLEMLQSDFRGEIGGLRDETTRLATIPVSPHEDAVSPDQGSVTAEAEALEIEPQPILDPAPEVEELPVAENVTPRPKRTARASAAEAPPSYERIQSPEGKVYYRKVQ